MNARIDKLKRMLERTPQDPFLLYALGMEHKKEGELAASIDYFSRTIAVDPGYCYAYHQRGLAQAAAGDRESARQSLKEGIEAARKKGDGHAAQEIMQALEEMDE